MERRDSCFPNSIKGQTDRKRPAVLKPRIGIRIKVHCRGLRAEIIHKYSSESMRGGGGARTEEASENHGFLLSSSRANGGPGSA